MMVGISDTILVVEQRGLKVAGGKIKKDVIVFNLTEEMVLNRSDRKKRIHVANPKNVDEGFIFIVVL